MTPDEPPQGWTDDALLGGTVRLRQPAKGHRAGTDAVLLAGLSDVRPGERVIDAGSATGAVGLMIAARVAGIRLTLVDRDPELVAASRWNLAANGWGTESEAVEADLFGGPDAWLESGLREGDADLVVTNPPFFDAGERASPHPGRRDAHRMAGGDLQGWIEACRWLIRPGGRLTLIHRADRMLDCLNGLRPGFGDIAVRPIHPREGVSATRVLISARRGARSPLALLPPLILHGSGGGFTELAAALHAAPSGPHQRGVEHPTRSASP